MQGLPERPACALGFLHACLHASQLAVLVLVARMGCNGVAVFSSSHCYRFPVSFPGRGVELVDGVSRSVCACRGCLYGLRFACDLIVVCR